jgi:XrtJ-associated TM-motif-TM protein
MGGSAVGMAIDSFETRIIMKRSFAVSLGCALFLVTARTLQAQSGCTDSPENPTVVLALVGGVGAFYSAVKARMKTRRGRE